MRILILPPGQTSGLFHKTIQLIRLSVVIITLNEAHNIERCVKSALSIADEILVVDSLSTDNTAEVAGKLGARIVLQPFTDYVQQRIIATNEASYDWVLSIDADEVISEDLAKSIAEIKKSPKHDYYKLICCTNYCGKWIRHGTWYPDKKIRLFDRTKGTWQGAMIHEYWQPAGTTTAGMLQGELLHYSFYTISDHIKQIEKFTELSAIAAVKQGKTCSRLKVWLGPKWFFFNAFILRLGFLDGYYGYLVCKYSAMSTMIKYSKIRQYSA